MVSPLSELSTEEGGETSLKATLIVDENEMENANEHLEDMDDMEEPVGMCLSPNQDWGRMNEELWDGEVAQMIFLNVQFCLLVFVFWLGWNKEINLHLTHGNKGFLKIIVNYFWNGIFPAGGAVNLIAYFLISDPVRRKGERETPHIPSFEKWGNKTYTFCRIWTLAPNFFIQWRTGALAGFTTA